MKTEKKWYIRLISIFCSIIFSISIIFNYDLNLINNTTVYAEWTSVSDFQSYALNNWTKPIQASYLEITGARAFGYGRDSGSRTHAANDYVCDVGTPVYAMTSGTVSEFSSNFYGGTQAIGVTNVDGSVARYCEISTSLRVGSTVEKGQQIGTIIANNIGGGHMLHLELYLGTATGSLTNTSNNTYWYVSSATYKRRCDLLDPTFLQNLGISILPEGCSCSEDYKGDYIVATESSNLMMRSGHGTGYSVITSIPKGATVYVSKADGMWAHVEYAGNSGYCSMQYLNKTAPSECSCSTDYAGDYIVTTESTALNMRSDHSSSSSIVTKIPKDTTVYVSKADGTWAHVEYNGNSGYCSMQYLTKVEPAPVVPSKPEYLNISDCNSMTSIILSWSPCENTDYYDIRYYTSDGTIINTVSGWTDTQYIINLDYGDYYFNIASVNNNGNYTFSENFNFSVSKGDLVPTCLETYNNHIYALYDVVTSYENANRYAQALGGHLATITSKEENDYIISLKNKGAFTSKHCWLGATDLDSEGTWKWCTGEEFSYSNWDVGQPDNYSDLYGTENYLEIWENGYWNDANNCNTILKGFIVEIEPLTEIKSEEYNNHTYYVFNNTLSWTEANQYAQNMGGYLVEIDNEKENEFIHSLAKESGLGGYWISLKDTGYTNFKDGEPNNDFGLENYYHMYSETGKWNDADNCQGLSCSIGFIVEINTTNQKNIKLNNPKLSIQETKNYQLKLLNFDDSKKVVWISDNTSIATVDNGLVTGISKGIVNIYAIVDGISYCSKVTVYPYQENLILGDCNNNGKVTFTDLLMLKKYVIGINLGNTINLYNADINYDTEINILDIICLKQILINLNDN